MPRRRPPPPRRRRVNVDRCQRFLAISATSRPCPVVARRLAPTGLHAGEPPPDEFWQIVARYEISPRDEEFWLAILPSMVECPHAFVAPGDAVARAGVAKARVERWLRLDQARAWREANRLLARLDAGLDWTRFGPLLYRWSEEDRRTFARQFFLSPALRKPGA